MNKGQKIAEFFPREELEMIPRRKIAGFVPPGDD